MRDLKHTPVHLGLGASASVLTPISGPEWYQTYSEEHALDGKEGRLVSMYTFEEPWNVWEMHPVGAEVVLCTKGTLVLLQEIDGKVQKTVLDAGQFAINPPGVWHTADVSGPTDAVFITAGMGTEHRPRA